MDNKIIAAAREAGQYADAEYQRAWDAGEGASWQQIRDARFYAIARTEALEDAAKACRPFGKTGAVVAAAIKALKEQP